MGILREPEHLNEFVDKMISADLPKAVIRQFSDYYRQIVSGGSGLLREQEIRPVRPADIADAKELDRYVSDGRKALGKTVMIKLNGGLGTSMGLQSAKSLLSVREGRNFLEIIIKQSEVHDAALALMNSFSTHEDTSTALGRIQPKRHPFLFLQHKFPKILQSNLSPAEWPPEPDLEWNPPGHGDIYLALATSGTLQKLLDRGLCYAFISNSDNLGATLNLSLLGYFASNGLPFMMEVTRRTQNDRKGGHLARRVDGGLVLRELAQCPEKEIDLFTDIQRYWLFNTNNIWIDLKFLQAQLAAQERLPLPLILNPKTLDPRADASPAVYQVETAMGSAISLFEDATAVHVPRSRFFPVKTTEDLLVVRSDCFEFSSKYQLRVNPGKSMELPSIRLDPRYYRKIDDFNRRFATVPSLRDCRSLSIQGDVRFEPGVTLKGHVLIKNNHPIQAVIAENSQLEGEVIF